MKDEHDMATSIRITRRTDKERVIIGDIVRYSVTIHNDFPYILTGITIVENISPDVLLLPDSFSCEDTRFTVDQASATLTCDVLASYEQVTFHYQILISNRPTSHHFTSSSTITYTIAETEHTMTTESHSLIAITTAASTGSHIPQTNLPEQSDTSFMNQFAQKISIPIVYDFRVSAPMNQSIQGDLQENHYDSYRIQRQPKYGIADIDLEGKWTYTPYQDHRGTDFFIIDIFDHYGNKYYFNMIISTQKIISPTQPTIVQFDEGRRNRNTHAQEATTIQKKPVPSSEVIIQDTTTLEIPPTNDTIEQPTISKIGTSTNDSVSSSEQPTIPNLDVPIHDIISSSEQYTPTPTLDSPTYDTHSYGNQQLISNLDVPLNGSFSFGEQQHVPNLDTPLNGVFSFNEYQTRPNINISIDEAVSSNEQNNDSNVDSFIHEKNSFNEQHALSDIDIPIQEEDSSSEQHVLSDIDISIHEEGSSSERHALSDIDIPIQEEDSSSEQHVDSNVDVFAYEIVPSSEHQTLSDVDDSVYEDASPSEQHALSDGNIFIYETPSATDDPLMKIEQLTFDEIIDEMITLEEQMTFDEVIFAISETSTIPNQPIVDAHTSSFTTNTSDEQPILNTEASIHQEVIVHLESTPAHDNETIPAEILLLGENTLSKEEITDSAETLVMDEKVTLMLPNEIIEEETESPASPLPLTALEVAYMGEIDATQEQIHQIEQPEPETTPQTTQQLMPLGMPNVLALQHYNLQLVHKRSLIPISLAHHDDEATSFKLVNTKGEFGTFSYLTRKGNTFQEEYLTVNLTKFTVQNRQAAHQNEGLHHGD